ncbi:DNA mismatch repair protein Mlh1-like [Artemia franciscana]|uniref:DNA mismatch repair protein S5 domain-containing protein n=1 Tax=Artemia franciscana TaxID=6661 RepID=A0AA88H800_ARTSF|nr:hypothetical protein QYM36_019395 [Artemia franciscana]
MTTRIKELEEHVVNRIAAGEVIQRPANALKELLENSLDAGANSVQVTTKDGGLKLLQIQDNGCGIAREDLDIVCKRFTTSKLSKFEDLESIATFGFRGEALASISHVAHLTLTTKTTDSPCAFRASYIDGKLTSPPLPCAATQGTALLIEDLFYNVPSRRKMFKSPSEEQNKVFDVMSKYSIHNPSIGFCLKKYGDIQNDLKTSVGSTTLDNIRIIYGGSVARELLEINYSDSKYDFKVKGYTSQPSYSTKKFVFILFINNRLVDCNPLKRALELVYARILPKGAHPFVYMALDLLPQTLDVNVHPTKHEVRFLNEDSIVERIQKELESVLLGHSSSRTFVTQALLPCAAKPLLTPSDAKDKTEMKRVYDHQLVRTDSKLQKLDKFLDSIVQGQMQNQSGNHSETMNVDSSFETNKQEKYENKKKRRNIVLSSVQSLKKEVDAQSSDGLRDLIKNHTFVGVVNSQFSLIQHQTKLFICNTIKLREELFYQTLLEDFGNFAKFRFSDPLPIHELALIALTQEDSGWTEEDGPKEELARFIADSLKSRAPMLADYFSIEITETADLVTIPMLLDDYTPPVEGLPMYVLRLASEVQWDSEKECFETFCRETAKFYGASAADHINTESGSEMKRGGWKWITEHVVFPAFKSNLINPPEALLQDNSLLQIANLPDLYKVFERC